jgi:hypothetical protein
MFANAISGLVLLCLSVGYYLTADAMPSSILDTTVTSAAFPKLLAIAGGLLSSALIIQNLVSWRLSARPASASSPDPDVPDIFNWTAHRRALGLLGIVTIFIIALEVVGYPAAIGLLILAVSVYQGYRLSLLSVAVAVGGALFFWLFFMVFLGIHMPLGIFSRFAASHFLPFA